MSFKVFKEVVDAIDVVLLVSVPKYFLFCFSKLIIRSMNREVNSCGLYHKVVVPLLHHIAPPAENSAFVNAHSFVGDDKVFVDAENFSKTFAGGASTDRIVETEKVYRWLFKGNSICLKAVGERMLL